MTGRGTRNGGSVTWVQVALATCLVTSFASACGKRTAELPPPVARAVAVVDGLRAHPDAPDSVLAAHGLDSRSFDSLLFEIAEDPVLAEAYTRAIHGNLAKP